jgi:hypothetical protein
LASRVRCTPDRDHYAAMLIVHQMAKVASHTWCQTVRDVHGRDEPQPIHCHFMMPATREHIAAALNGPPDRRTIANMLIAKSTLRDGAATWARLLSARQANETIRVISGIREPVSRSISIILFLADFYGHVDRPLNPRVAMTPEYVIEFLRESWCLVLDRREPRGTFEWLLWYLIGAYRTWFAEELGAAFGVDVLQTEFSPGQASQRITAPAADVLIYRVEDMQPTAPGYSALLRQASAFLQGPIRAFPVVNTSTARRSHDVSEAVRGRFSLPAATLNRIYDDPIIRHFYSGQEIDGWIARWAD